MSTGYPILGNRPINKWKVAELKEELKRRSLPIKGLKDDLVKRLDEAIRIEWQASKAQEEGPDGSNVGNSEIDKAEISGVHVAEGGVDQDNMVSHQVYEFVNQMGIDDATTQFNRASDLVSHNGSVGKGDEVQVAADHNEAQVFDEVNHKLGFKVTSESFSTNTLTNNKNELKDNLNDDNVQLESEFVRQDMVQPSFGTDSRGGGTIYLSDDITSRGNQTFDGVTDDIPKKLGFSEKNYNEDKLSVDNLVGGQSLGNEAIEKVANDNGLIQMDSANVASSVPFVAPQETEPPIDIAFFGEESNSQDCHDFDKTIGMMDGELLEKVNLDQSSADEMEDDTLDTKLLEPDHDSSKINYSNKEPGVGMGDKMELSNDHIDSVTALSEKRKFQDVTISGSNEPLKRQRIETPKERVVPPSERTPTTSIRIDNFVRPFTLKAVRELLAKTGEVCSFWMDHIKTHCYVTFSSAEEAIETRNAVYNLQWPTNGGRLLIADYVDPEEVKLRVEGLYQSAEPSANVNTSALAVQTPVPPAESAFQQPPMQHQELPHPLSRVPPARGPSTFKNQLPVSASLVDENLEPPEPSLDELFRKTKATPQIYYSPLSDKEVAAKVSRQKRDRQ